LEQRENQWHLSFQVDHPALQQLWSQRLGRTVLLTNRLDWTAEQVVAGYSGQQEIERVFRGLKDGEWLGWGPMYHWTDSKIRIHAFYCMLGISLLQYLHREFRKGAARAERRAIPAPFQARFPPHRAVAYARAEPYRRWGATRPSGPQTASRATEKPA
jgi:hypothetical protein